MDLKHVKEKLKKEYELAEKDLRRDWLEERDRIFHEHQNSQEQAKDRPESYRKQLEETYSKIEDNAEKRYQTHRRNLYQEYKSNIEKAEIEFLEHGGTQQEVEATREHRIIEGVVPDSESDSKNIEEEKEKKKQSILQMLFKGKDGKEKDGWSR